MASMAVLMPAEQTRAEFLASSHFAIGHDKKANQQSTKSVFKRDYIPWENLSRQRISEPPRPSEVLHRDARYFNERTSETVNSFVKQPLKNEILTGAQAKLGATTFKLDADVSKFNSFRTSHNIDFTPKPYARQSLYKENHRTVIPQGDREKVGAPISDYRDRFQGHDTSKIRIDKAPSKHHGGPPTIVGDARQHHFDTTSSDTFRGRAFPRVQSLQAPIGTNIPDGDPEKFRSSRTTFQVSYPEHDRSLLRCYDKSGVTTKLQKSTFNQSDGHGEWETYQSTMAESYQPAHHQYEKHRREHHRNHSDLPPGDDHPHRVTDTANMTTNRFFMGKPYNAPKPPIISGAPRRTRSNVWFGDPVLGQHYYDTTMEDQYKPCGPQDRSRPPLDANTKSSVPTDYYKGLNTVPTALASYQDPQQLAMEVNPEAIERLKRSHISAPLGGERQFSTEHHDQYVPKSATLVAVDSGKLQRSKVPLGTFKF